jgi:hypothetical protein
MVPNDAATRRRQVGVRHQLTAAGSLAAPSLAHNSTHESCCHENGFAHEPLRLHPPDSPALASVARPVIRLALPRAVAQELHTGDQGLSMMSIHTITS